jgi:hypothetical protein
MLSLTIAIMLLGTDQALSEKTSVSVSIRVAQLKEITSNSKFDNVVKFEFVLKGLASSNSSLTARLEEDFARQF